jgi:hypothetical protein
MNSPIIAPMLALAGWTLVIWVWMYATRLPAMARAGIDGMAMIGSSSASLRAALIARGEERACWVADNYNHLLEQPTLFYATAIALALLGEGSGTALAFAWAYAGLRIAHSLVQIISNRVVVRFALFALASLCLIAMVALGALAFASSGRLR